MWPQPTLTLPFHLKTSSAGCYFACSVYLPLGSTRNLRPPEAQADQFVSTLLLGGDLPWFSSRIHRCCRMGWSEIFDVFYWPAFSYKGGYTQAIPRKHTSSSNGRLQIMTKEVKLKCLIFLLERKTNGRIGKGKRSYADAPH